MWSLSHSKAISEQNQRAAQEATTAFLARTDLGFFQPSLWQQSLLEVEALRQDWGRYHTWVVIGLGGSSLGARALLDALVPSSKQKKVHFLDNVDAITLQTWAQEVEKPDQLAWLVCSKSGGTIESLALYDFCAEIFKETHHIDIPSSTFVVTEKKMSPLGDFADRHSRPRLTVPDNVGGRFSVFTPVGLVPAAVAGLAPSKLLEGCHWALGETGLLQDLVATLWQSHQDGEKVFYSFQYCDRLKTFGLWLQQLWSESLGKANRRDGSDADAVATFLPCRGASDQHSVLQQIIDGPESKLVSFHRVLDSEQGNHKLKSSQFSQSLMLGRYLGELLGVQASATEQAIRESQSGTLVLKTANLTEASLSGLMSLWMLSVGVLGELLDIDAFNQPGVESGKSITRRVLSQAD